jgi:hypothetical protein
MKKIAEKTQEYYINFINDNDWWFNDATIDDRQAIIHAGSKMKYDLIEQHDASHESERIKDILAEKNSLLSNCDSTIKHQYDMILQKEEDNQKILAELQLEKSNLLIEKDKMRQDAEISAMNRVDNELSLLKIRLNDHQNMMDKLKINENEQRQQVINEKNNEIDRIINQKEKELKRILEEKCVLSENYDNLVKKITENDNKSTKKKGDIGEKWLFEVLKQDFPTYHIEDAHGKGYQGDYIMTLERDSKEIKILYDAKYYDKDVNVRKKCVDQIKRDMNNTKCNIGILVSLNGGIVGIPHLEIECFENNKVMVGVHYAIDNRDAIKLATYSALSCWLNRMHQSVAEEEKTSMLESVNMTLDFLINIDKNIKNMEFEMKNMKDNKKKAYDMLERLVKKDAACEVKKTRRGRKKIAEPLKDEN